MNYIDLSDFDLTVSQIIYGVWRWLDDPEGFGLERIEHKVQTCMENGITAFDHADLYGDYQIEGIFGKLLLEKPHLRQEMVLISKCGIQLLSQNRPQNRVKHYDTSPEYIQFSVERTLKELHTDYLDILLIHRPDPLMNAEETGQALDKLVDDGKVRFIGVSNFSNAQYELLSSQMEEPLVTNQIELSLLHTAPITDGTLDFLQSEIVNPMAWSPLGGGRIFSGQDAQAVRVRTTLEEMAKKYNALPEQIALAWLLHFPWSILPVLGTNNLDRIKQSAQATDIKLDKQDWFILYTASLGNEIP